MDNVSFQMGNDRTQCQPVIFFRETTPPMWVSRIMTDWQILFTLAAVSSWFSSWYQ